MVNNRGETADWYQIVEREKGYKMVMVRGLSAVFKLTARHFLTFFVNQKFQTYDKYLADM